MKRHYDMCVDLNTLNDLHVGLKRIKLNIESSVSQMDRAMGYSQDYLSGEQFEKARAITDSCLERNKITVKNIEHALKYLEELMEQTERYNKLMYQRR
ncbi:MAG: hypothetical protein IJ746_04425 [Ruminococcus sp.]|nr:hypothetical protein [Ruminococcus sp.]